MPSPDDDFPIPDMARFKVATSEDLQRQAEAAKAHERAQLSEAILSIPRSFQRLTLESLRASGMSKPGLLTKISAYTSPEQDVVLGGDAGIGKTSVAAALFTAWLFSAREPLTQRKLARFFAARNLGLNGGRDRRAVIDLAMEAPFAVLDDVGAEEPTVFGRATLGAIIAERHAQARPTIITTAMKPTDVAVAYGDGIARRIFERSVVFTWERGE